MSDSESSSLDDGMIRINSKTVVERVALKDHEVCFPLMIVKNRR
jgi:hypothetical protein